MLVGGIGLLDSKAITKIQSIILIIIIVVATTGSLVYILRNDEKQTSETIKIGILTDLDATIGKGEWQAAILAVEQINAEGGILERQVEIIGEDTDAESGPPDMAVINTAITRLITYHKVDFIIGGGSGEMGFMCQEVAADNKKILLTGQPTDGFTERVADDYEKYKYFFGAKESNSHAHSSETT